MKAVTKLFFFDEEGNKFFGEGPCRLLQGIKETGSLHAAAAEMGMAYTKALKILIASPNLEIFSMCKLFPFSNLCHNNLQYYIFIIYQFYILCKLSSLTHKKVRTVSCTDLCFIIQYLILSVY